MFIVNSGSNTISKISKSLELTEVYKISNPYDYKKIRADNDGNLYLIGGVGIIKISTIDFSSSILLRIID